MSATVLAATAPVVVAPAMHTEMWEHPATQRNVEQLVDRRLSPRASRRGCAGRRRRGTGANGRTRRDRGSARRGPERSDPERLARPRHGRGDQGTDRSRALHRQSLLGEDGQRHCRGGRQPRRRRDAGDGCRGTGSSGRRGGRGRDGRRDGRARSGPEPNRSTSWSWLRRWPTSVPTDARTSKLRRADGPPDIELEPTPDILAGVAAMADRPFLVGFAAETGSLEEAVAKAKRKGVDLLVANDVSKTDPASVPTPTR